jgi:hypothetical protein
MLFTLIIWAFAAFGLILACLFYVIFLWHHIPSLDGTLARYCRRKVDKRLAQIVGVKIKRAIEREDRQRNGDSISNSRLKHQPTLPIVDDDKHALSRQTTQSTLTQYNPQSPLDSVDPFGSEEQRLNALVGIRGPRNAAFMLFSLSFICLASYSTRKTCFAAKCLSKSGNADFQIVNSLDLTDPYHHQGSHRSRRLVRWTAIPRTYPSSTTQVR